MFVITVWDGVFQRWHPASVPIHLLEETAHGIRENTMKKIYQRPLTRVEKRVAIYEVMLKPENFALSNPKLGELLGTSEASARRYRNELIPLILENASGLRLRKKQRDLLVPMAREKNPKPLTELVMPKMPAGHTFLKRAEDVGRDVVIEEHAAEALLVIAINRNARLLQERFSPTAEGVGSIESARECLDRDLRHYERGAKLYQFNLVELGYPEEVLQSNCHVDYFYGFKEIRLREQYVKTQFTTEQAVDIITQAFTPAVKDITLNADVWKQFLASSIPDEMQREWKYSETDAWKHRRL